MKEGADTVKDNNYFCNPSHIGIKAGWKDSSPFKYQSYNI